MPRQRRGSHKRQPVVRPDRRLDPESLQAAAQLYLAMLSARGRSPTTVATRASGLRTFTEWCELRAVRRPEEVNRAIVEAYQGWLHTYRRDNGHALSFYGQAGRLAAVRGLFAWLARTERIAANPAADLELPRQPRRLPRHVLNSIEAERVLAEAVTRTMLGLRDRAILEALYSTGMRRMELVGLDVADVDVERGTIFVRHAKGRQQRVVPIGQNNNRYHMMGLC